MSILYVVTQADGGGAQKYVLTLAKYFHGQIAAGDTDNELFEAAKKIGIKTYRLKHLKRSINPLRDMLALWELTRLIKQADPDIVHLNSSKAGLLGSIAGKLSGKAVVFTAHGFLFLQKNSPVVRFGYWFLEKFASYFRDYIIAVSEHDTLSAIKYRVISAQKIITIHNGLPPIKFLSREEARSKLKLGVEITIGTVAQYYHNKGLDILIKAAAQLLQQKKLPLRLILLGEGPERKNLQNLIEKLNLNKTVSLLGYQPNAAILLKAFDIFVLPSRKEGFPFALLEAMQAGVPIVATDAGGNKESLVDAGLIVPPDNPDALAESLAVLLEDPNLISSIKNKATLRSTLFREGQMLTETKTVYDKLLKQV